MTISEPDQLDRDSAVPLYRQIAEYLAGEILSGRLAPGASLGSEAELQQQFSVSRITLRQAIGLLVEQDLVVRKQGKGTYVEAIPLRLPLGALKGTTEIARQLGRFTRSRVLSRRVVKGRRNVREILGVPDDEKLLEIRRVDYAGDEPIALAAINLPYAIGARLSTAELEEEPLYPLIERKHFIVAEEAYETIQAAHASENVARQLGISVASAIMTVTRATRDNRGNMIEYSVVDFKASAIQFSVSLRRRSGELNSPVRFGEHVLINAGKQ
jgi:GntR family transcriptional regulator